MSFLQKIRTFFKKEMVLCISGLLAILSMFFMPPSAEYMEYMDWRVLALLFCLMLVVAGFRKIGFFQYLGSRLLSGVKKTRSLCLLLVALAFFSSMFITNDVALITFVPFAVMILSMAGQSNLLIPVVVLQTIAANLGSMLTPVGNPQNLYLYSAFELSMGNFLLDMLPLAALSGLLLLISLLLLPNRALSLVAQEKTGLDYKKVLILFALFIVCLLCVLHVLPWPIMTLTLLIAILLLDKTLFVQVDYFLLLTFVCFFLFIGNMERIPAISDFLNQFIQGRELLLGVTLSQGISNVPAAILLSGFTSNAKALLYGVNIGGLGTLIASLASLISYRLYSASEGAKAGKYLLVFTVYNLIFLAILYPVAMILL